MKGMVAYDFCVDSSPSIISDKLIGMLYTVKQVHEHESPLHRYKKQLTAHII
jgi:hypothetical protein